MNETWSRDPDWVYLPGEDRPVKVEDLMTETLEPKKRKKLLKLGGQGVTRVYPHRPKPPAVKNHYDNHTEASGELSSRAQWWLEMIERGWRPNRHTLRCCWDCNSEWLGVYGWEYMGPISVALQNGRFGDFDRAQAVRAEQLRLSTPLGPQTVDEWFEAVMKDTIRSAIDEEMRKSILDGDGLDPLNLKGIL